MNLHRNIRKATVVKIARFSSSIKSKSMNYVESLLEDDITTLLDFDSTVESFVTQPASFFYQNDAGYWRRYTPDLLIKRVTGEYEFAEVKPKLKTLKEDFQRKHGLHKAAIKARTGKELILITESDIHTSRLVQLNQVAPYFRCKRHENAEFAVTNFLQREGAATLSTLADISEKCGSENFYPMVMLAHQLISCVNDEVIEKQTIVELA